MPINPLSIEPMPHHKLQGFWRVPLKEMPPEYKVFVSRDAIRMFTDVTLPDYVKSKLTMAKAEGIVPKPDVELFPIDMFIYRGNGLEDVAWRASQTMYVVVLSDSQLEELKGVPT